MRGLLRINDEICICKVGNLSHCIARRYFRNDTPAFTFLNIFINMHTGRRYTIWPRRSAFALCNVRRRSPIILDCQRERRQQLMLSNNIRQNASLELMALFPLTRLRGVISRVLAKRRDKPQRLCTSLAERYECVTSSRAVSWKSVIKQERRCSSLAERHRDGTHSVNDILNGHSCAFPKPIKHVRMICFNDNYSKCMLKINKDVTVSLAANQAIVRDVLWRRNGLVS